MPETTPTPDSQASQLPALPPPAHVPSARTSALTGTQKSAILMIILGDQASADILRELDEEEVQRIGREIAAIPTITSEMAEEILTEFYSMLVAQQYVLKGGMEYARKVLVNAFGPDQARRLLDRVLKGLGNNAASFDALQKADPQQLANFIHSEHPQTIALILSHLGPQQAAGLLASLPLELRADVAVRMANLDQISPEIISKIAGIIGQKLKALGETSREAYGGVRAVAEMLNRLDQNTGKELLETIESQDIALGETIRHLMFVFEDLLKVEVAGVRELLARVDRKILTIALKGTSDALRDHFLKAMSARGAEMLREDMDSMGPIKLKEVEAAQQQIIGTVRLLESEGVISLTESSGDKYVN